MDSQNGGECCEVLGGKPPNEWRETRKINLQRALTSPEVIHSLTETVGVEWSSVVVEKKHLSGYYSDVYRLSGQSISTSSSFSKQFVLKLVNYEWCPKKSNYDNELAVCRLLKVSVNKMG